MEKEDKKREKEVNVEYPRPLVIESYLNQKPPTAHTVTWPRIFQTGEPCLFLLLSVFTWGRFPLSFCVLTKTKSK